jgi:hypothetical protein
VAGRPATDLGKASPLERLMHAYLALARALAVLREHDDRFALRLGGRSTRAEARSAGITAGNQMA